LFGFLTRLSMSCHMLDHAGLTAFYMGYAVAVRLCARVDVHSFINSRC
jgi:hypothetical protein